MHLYLTCSDPFLIPFGLKNITFLKLERGYYFIKISLYLNTRTAVRDSFYSQILSNKILKCYQMVIINLMKT